MIENSFGVCYWSLMTDFAASKAFYLHWLRHLGLEIKMSGFLEVRNVMLVRISETTTRMNHTPFYDLVAEPSISTQKITKK